MSLYRKKLRNTRTMQPAFCTENYAVGFVSMQGKGRGGGWLRLRKNCQGYKLNTNLYNFFRCHPPPGSLGNYTTDLWSNQQLPTENGSCKWACLAGQTAYSLNLSTGRFILPWNPCSPHYQILTLKAWPLTRPRVRAAKKVFQKEAKSWASKKRKFRMKKEQNLRQPTQLKLLSHRWELINFWNCSSHALPL